MGSIEGLERVKAPQDGFQKVQQKLTKQRQGLRPSELQQPNHSWMKVAAVIALVVCSNIWVVTNYLKSDSQTLAESGVYSQVTTDFNLYEND